ncbi:MAG TPA: hypothetical protein VNU95_03140 [Candidatus Acidoferrales bacterium]|jgi:hypothetical protein|nr:hypothetical protein [Candidatus Acidoferrales bacterium]
MDSTSPPVPFGETRAKEREDRQGGGHSSLLSGGDERSEPESLISSSTREGETDDARDGAADGRGEAAPAAALPCLSSNNCIGKGNDGFQPSLLSPYRKKSRHRLISAVKWMVEKYGLNNVGLLTLSFGVPGSGRGSAETQELREQAKDLDFVQKRWHSLNTNILSKRYPDWICIPEPHKDGVWHLHVVVATKMDIRTGTDIETLSNYKLPYWMRRGKHLRNEALAGEWQALREIACKYRFGRIELLPVKKTGEALARYLAGYLTKSFNMIPPGQKHRLIRFSRGVSRVCSMQFTIRSLGNLIYRTRLKLAASMLHFREYGDFADYFGPRWHYYLSDIIAEIPIPMVFGKNDFKSGLASQILNDFAEDPFPFLPEDLKKKMMTVNGALLRKFTDLAFDETV